MGRQDLQDDSLRGTGGSQDGRTDSVECWRFDVGGRVLLISFVTAKRRCGEGAKRGQGQRVLGVRGASSDGAPAVSPERSVDRCGGTALWIRAAGTGRREDGGTSVRVERFDGRYVSGGRVDGQVGRGRIAGTGRRPPSWLWCSGLGQAPWRSWDERVGVVGQEAWRLLKCGAGPRSRVARVLGSDAVRFETKLAGIPGRPGRWKDWAPVLPHCPELRSTWRPTFVRKGLGR